MAAEATAPAAPPVRHPAVLGLSPWALWFAGGAFFTCDLGQVSLGVIQPTVISDLGLTTSEGQWVVNSFFSPSPSSPPPVAASAISTGTGASC